MKWSNFSSTITSYDFWIAIWQHMFCLEFNLILSSQKLIKVSDRNHFIHRRTNFFRYGLSLNFFLLKIIATIFVWCIFVKLQYTSNANSDTYFYYFCVKVLKMVEKPIVWIRVPTFRRCWAWVNWIKYWRSSKIFYDLWWLLCTSS